MNAVIYARYSSDNQREESIEGQIRECTAYAERNGITVVRHYIDRAFSAKTDHRPDFQQMIRDSNKKLFEIVLVWKFDRFARNRFDSANYKMILKKNNVHLISVMEPIAEGSQGILVETLLEGMAEYYSAELSEKVIRGQTENALKGKCTGGTGTIGYKIDADKFYRIDPLVAPLVLEAFQRYDNGEKIVEILNYLNAKGVRNMLGGKLTCSSMNTMLKNRRYIGELSFRDTVVPDAIPAIVPKDLFDRVQKRLEKNKRAPAHGKADEEYLLTTKLFCGKCGALMFGESGTSATGRTYYYYKCATAKRRKGCNKKTVQKEWLENLVVQETMKLIHDDAVIERIVQLVMDFQNQENTTIPLLEKQLREVDRKLDNLMKAIEEGLFTRTTKERLDALEAQKDELTAKIADEKLRKPSFNADFIRFWLMKFRKFDISQQKQRKALIEIFVNAIFLYDDRMLITFNYKDGSQTIRFEDALTTTETVGNSSDLSGSARYDKKPRYGVVSDVLYRGFFYLLFSRSGGHAEHDAVHGCGGNEDDRVQFFQLGHIPGADEHQNEQDKAFSIQHEAAEIVDAAHLEQGVDHDLDAGGADQGHRGGAQAVQGVVHQLAGAELIQEVGDDEDADDGGADQTDGGGQGAQDAAHHAVGPAADGIAHVGGHVDAHRAGGALGDGDHIGQLACGVPARLGGDILQEGHGGHAAADGEQASLKKLPEQTKIDHFPRTPHLASRLPSTPATMTDSTGEKSKNTAAAKSTMYITRVALSTMADLMSLSTAFRMKTQTQTRMPARAFCTQTRLAKLLMSAAMMEMMTSEGEMTPSVATMPPMFPAFFRPMKVAVLTAMTPGVHWPMAK